MVFFDSSTDKTGKTYLAYKCAGEGGYWLSLYSRDVLATFETGVTLVVKQGSTLSKGDGYIRRDRQTGKLSVWESEYSDVIEGLNRTLMNANGPVTVTVMREGGDLAPVSYKFDTRGLSKAMKAVNGCW